MDETGLDVLEQHLTRRNKVAELFHKADAHATLCHAGRARNRKVLDPKVGMLVYYFRRAKGTKHQPINQCYRGPARIIAVEESQSRNQATVV